MQKIIPCLWFDSDAEEAVNLYTSVFKNSSIDEIALYPEAAVEVSGKPAGSVMTLDFTLCGQKFLALNGGDNFKYSPAISFFVTCDSEQELMAYYERLSEGGAVLMELKDYPFSSKYTWITDKYGVSWQLNLRQEKSLQSIVPCLMFVGDQDGHAESAMNFYTSLFDDSSIDTISRYKEGENGIVDSIKYATFFLEKQAFMVMDSSGPHRFGFTGAISFIANCDTQKEIDFLWDTLVEEGKPSECGWLADEYGVWWQIVPAVLPHLLNGRDVERSERVMREFLTMTKINLPLLEEAYNR